MAVLVGGKHAKILRDIVRHSGAGSCPLVASRAAPGEADVAMLRREGKAVRMLLAPFALLATVE